MEIFHTFEPPPPLSTREIAARCKNYERDFSPERFFFGGFFTKGKGGCGIGNGSGSFVGGIYREWGGGGELCPGGGEISLREKIGAGCCYYAGCFEGWAFWLLFMGEERGERRKGICRKLGKGSFIPLTPANPPSRPPSSFPFPPLHFPSPPAPPPTTTDFILYARCVGKKKGTWF